MAQAGNGLRALALVGLLALVISCRPGTAGASDTDGPVYVSRERPLMGTYFRVQVVAPEQQRAEAAIDAALDEVARVEALLSEWREASEISAVNRAAGERAVAVGPELYMVVERALEVRELTRGAFDITFAACGRLWSFRPPRVPEAAELERCLSHVGRPIRLDPERSTIFLPEHGMQIGIAGIGKGYGVDRAAEVLASHGIVDYFIDGGGDIRVAGRKKDRPWRVGIAHPRRPGDVHATVEPGPGAIVTSGDYQQQFELDGVRYHHILDPGTGRPARKSVAVTVIAPDATRADALATGLFVLGPDAGMELVESLPGVEALFFDPDLNVHTSTTFPPLH